MLNGALANFQSLGHKSDYFAGKILTADSNYHSQVNLQKCQELGVDAYIPDRKFRNRDERIILPSVRLYLLCQQLGYLGLDLGLFLP